MGSGSKFSIGFTRGFGLALYYEPFPHEHSFSILLGCVTIYIGLGKGYDEL